MADAKPGPGRPKRDLSLTECGRLVELIKLGFSRASACAEIKIDPKTLNRILSDNEQLSIDIRIAEAARDQLPERFIYQLITNPETNPALAFRAAALYWARVDNAKKAREAKREKLMIHRAAEAEKAAAQAAEAAKLPAHEIAPVEADVIIAMRNGYKVTTVNHEIGVTAEYQRTNDPMSREGPVYESKSYPTDNCQKGRYFLGLDQKPVCDPDAPKAMTELAAARYAQMLRNEGRTPPRNES